MTLCAAAWAVFFAADFFTTAFFTGRLFVPAFAGAAFLAVVCFVATDFGYAAAARFAALAARAFARFATSAAFRAGDIFFFAGVFFTAGFSALTASHRFFVAATIAALPARLSFRFFLGAASGIAGSATLLEAAHLLRWASPMRFRAAALIFRRFLGVAGPSAVAAGWVEPPVSQARSSAILASSFSFWASIPKIAAFTISVVSFGVGMLLDLPRSFHRKGDALINTTPTVTLRGRVA